MHSIVFGDEVTFDYVKRNYNIQYFLYECSCHESNSKGSITGWKELPESVKIVYKRFVAPYLIAIDLKLKESVKH